MISLREVPLSGDDLTDWHFKEVVALLRKNNVLVERRKRVMDPDRWRRRALRGLMQPGIGSGGHGIKITISSAKRMNPNRDAEVVTLIHEASHAIRGKPWEYRIRGLESILARRFTKKQKDFIKKHFLPRHETK